MWIKIIKGQPFAFSYLFVNLCSLCSDLCWYRFLAISLFQTVLDLAACVLLSLMQLIKKGLTVCSQQMVTYPKYTEMMQRVTVT